MVDDRGRSVPRAVVTGRGAVTPVGLNWVDTWQSLVAGVSGIRELSSVDTTDLPVRIGGEVHGFDAAAALPPKLVRRTDPSVHLALVAALEAVEDAKLERGSVPADRIAVVIGSAGGQTKTSIAATQALAQRGPSRVSPFFFPSSGIDSAASEVALLFGAQGPATCVTTACATGSTAIGEAARLIGLGEADVVIAGGTDDTLTRLTELRRSRGPRDELRSARRPAPPGGGGDEQFLRFRRAQRRPRAQEVDRMTPLPLAALARPP